MMASMTPPSMASPPSMVGMTSPGKRARSPIGEEASTDDGGQPPAKSASSPSLRESSQFFGPPPASTSSINAIAAAAAAATAAASSSGSSGSSASGPPNSPSKGVGSMLQHATLDDDTTPWHLVSARQRADGLDAHLQQPPSSSGAGLADGSPSPTSLHDHSSSSVQASNTGRNSNNHSASPTGTSSTQTARTLTPINTSYITNLPSGTNSGSGNSLPDSAGVPPGPSGRIHSGGTDASNPILPSATTPASTSPEGMRSYPPLQHFPDAGDARHHPHHPHHKQQHQQHQQHHDDFRVPSHSGSTTSGSGFGGSAGSSYDGAMTSSTASVDNATIGYAPSHPSSSHRAPHGQPSGNTIAAQGSASAYAAASPSPSVLSHPPPAAPQHQYTTSATSPHLYNVHGSPIMAHAPYSPHATGAAVPPSSAIPTSYSTYAAASPVMSSAVVGGYQPVQPPMQAAAVNAGGRQPVGYSGNVGSAGGSQAGYSGGAVPTSYQSGFRRSIAGQSSAGGSSYHSGSVMSVSPRGGRRSEDMDATFTESSGGSGGTGLGSSGGSGSPSHVHPLLGQPAMSPYTGVADSPVPPKQVWSTVPSGVGIGPSVVQQSTHHAPGASPSVVYRHASGPLPQHMPGGPVYSPQPQQQQPHQQHAQNQRPQQQHQQHQQQPQQEYASQYAHQTGQTDYQSIVDEIMGQSRKGTDYGLELGDFQMIDTLGTGTFGRVLLVRLAPKSAGGTSAVDQFPPGMPHYFAMKVLTKSEVIRLKQVEHINCERSILGAVDHTGIVNLFCTFQDSLNIYMLLEFVQGGELFSHLRRAVRFSADVSRFYAANIILVLEYLHNRNLIYRDLKPENLLLDHQGYLKVTDFGFAKYVPDRTFTLCGTPEYLAPEIISSLGHGKAADWWAFGVLLFEMLCGYPPFFDESPWGIYEKILAGTFSFPPHVDPVARDLIRRLLSADRSKRLGNLRNGALDVRNHKWFDGVDWPAVERRMVPAPIIPRIKSTSDSQNFERYPSIPIESLPGLAKAQGYVIKEEQGPHETLFTNF